MKSSSLILIATILLGGCKNTTDKADAFGNFDATEVIISAETNGKIIQFDSSEGSSIVKGATIARIDTTILFLQKAEINAGMKSVLTRLSSVAAELSVYESKKATINEQIKRCTVVSPLKGTVIEKYSEAGEITGAGKPLVKIADLSVIKLKVYVSGAQLGKIKTGQSCTIRIDNGEKKFSSFEGKISYISEKAEFTPKIIQTKEERVVLVYAVNIDVINDGTLKSGMPGEALFTTEK